MKKVILGFLSIFFLGQLAIAQPISDHAVIPMAITVQSIMRLNVKSGGNIEFVFSKISDITNGIGNSAAYDTYFDISASQDWDLQIGTDAATFLNEAGASILLNRVELQVDDALTSTRFADADVISAFNAAPAALQNGPIDLITWVAGGTNGTNVGSAAENTFVVHWQCGVNLAARITGSVPGRYTVNVYLSLVAH